MTKRLLIAAALMASAFLGSSLVAATEVAGVKVEEQVSVAGTNLVLNGAGLRSKLFVKVYVGALYATQKASTAATFIDGTTPRRMTLRLLRDIDGDTLYGALYDGLNANHSGAELASLKPQIDQFADIIKRGGNPKAGDTIAIDFNVEGVAVSFNGEIRGKVAGGAFPKALMKVWLGDNPVDGALKKALLGS